MRLHAGSPESLDQKVRLRLAKSLDSLWHQTAPRLEPELSARQRLLDRIRECAQHPRVFARYYDLALALKSARIMDARHISDGLLELPEQARHPGTFAFAPETLGEDFDRFSRLLFAEEGLSRPLAAPDVMRFEATRRRLSEARDLIQEIDPEAAAEVAQLWPQIYLARPEQVGRVRFAGVTSFMTWGAGVMNVEAFDDSFVVATFLVHETTHSLLFALGCDEALVRNPLAESYSSPLRRDPRPMDGIFHATVVCARTFDFHRRCLDRHILDAARRVQVESRIGSVRSSYAAGRKVIDEHGQLSERARRLLEACDRVFTADAA